MDLSNDSKYSPFSLTYFPLMCDAVAQNNVFKVKQLFLISIAVWLLITQRVMDTSIIVSSCSINRRKCKSKQLPNQTGNEKTMGYGLTTIKRWSHRCYWQIQRNAYTYMQTICHGIIWVLVMNKYIHRKDVALLLLLVTFIVTFCKMKCLDHFLSSSYILDRVMKQSLCFVLGSIVKIKDQITTSYW